MLLALILGAFVSGMTGHARAAAVSPALALRDAGGVNADVTRVWYRRYYCCRHRYYYRPRYDDYYRPRYYYYYRPYYYRRHYHRYYYYRHRRCCYYYY